MPQTIFLVEDNPYERGLLSALLAQDANLRVVSLSRGQDALDMLGASAPDAVTDTPAVVLLDLSLPDVVGIDVLRGLRQAARSRRLPVVILSRSQHDIDIWASYRLGANAYLVKPTDPDALQAMVTRTVRFWTQVNARIPRGPTLAAA